MIALIFGSSGQDGILLKKLLNKKNIKVYTSSRHSGDFPGNISDYDFVFNIIRKISPNFIFNFAAISKISHEFIMDNFKAITNGSLNILESVLRLCPNSKVFLAGSAYQFKPGLSINEKSRFDYSNPYNLNRIFSVNLARYYREKFNLKIYIGYLFHHDSEFRKENHITIKISNYAKLVKNSNNKLDKLIIKNLDYLKEFNYAGDVVKAIWILINQTNEMEAVIGSGKSHTIKEWCRAVFKVLKLDWNKYVIESEQRDIKNNNYYVSDPTLIKSLGWKPEYDLEDLAIKILNFEKNSFY